MPSPKPQPTSFRLSSDAHMLLERLKAKLGLSKAACLERAIRMLARWERVDGEPPPDPREG
jgi:hypothetical protein